MHIGLLGGLVIEHDGQSVAVTGAMQLAVLFRLAVDAGSAVSYRAITEDVWSADTPENARAALQSIVSRLRSQLPPNSIVSTVGGYRLAVARSDVDALVFTDLVAAAVAALDGTEKLRLAGEALGLWVGEPWVPSDDFDWFERDLRRDRATAIELGGLAATPRPPSTIPVPLTELVGRLHELRAIADQLDSSRLVTIIGPGGAGKTRIAVEAAAGIQGTVLVELAPVGPDEIFTAILAATGREIRTAETATLTGSRDRVVEAIAGRPVLLVLDNCEHLIDAAAEAAEWLLHTLPGLRILATSREPLSISGEAFVALGALPHPDEAAVIAATDTDLRSFDAVELFSQRAVAARGHPLSDDEWRVAARICLRLDGLPLAIELAAAKLRTMTPAEVLTGLEDRFALLTGGSRTALPRHRTLRAMVDWSWSLLSDDERRAIAWLAVFPAGINTADATRVAAAMELRSAAVFDSLVDRSLLQRGRGRYRALETIREYGVERLAERDEVSAAREVQARFVAERASHNDGLLRGPKILEAISWFDSEEDNIAAALRYAAATHLAELAIDLTLFCTWYWVIRGREEESTAWFAVVAPLAPDAKSDAGRAIAVLAPLLATLSGSETDAHPDDGFPAGLPDIDVADLPRVAAGGHELLQLIPPLLAAFADAGADQAAWIQNARPPRGEDLGLDPWPTALLHVVRAAMAHNRGDIDLLGTEAAISVELFSALGDIWGLALAQQMSAEWLLVNGRLAEALAVSDRSTENFRRITPAWDLAQQQGLAISVMIRQGRIADARIRLSEVLNDADRSANARTQLQANVVALSAYATIGDVRAGIEALARIDTVSNSWSHLPIQFIAWIETARARIELLRGDRAAAEIALRRAVDAAIATHDYPVIGMVAVGCGTLALDRGDIEAAVQAVDLATAVMGIKDATDPNVVAIEEAALAHGIERADTVVPTRSIALESLSTLLSSR